jgi:hypothetical protein
MYFVIYRLSTKKVSERRLFYFVALILYVYQILTKNICEYIRYFCGISYKHYLLQRIWPSLRDKLSFMNISASQVLKLKVR